MKTALDAGGIRCAGLRDPQSPSGDGVLRKVCTSGDGDDVVLAIYPTYIALQSEVRAVAEATWLSTPKSILAGENWTILGPVVYVEDVQKILGGSITTSPS